MKKLLATTTVALLTFASAGNAQAFGLLKKGPSVFNYDHAGLTYLDDDGADGITLRFSAEYNQNYAWRVRYQQLDASGSDVDTLAGGITYHIQSSKYPNADWVLDAGLTSVDQELVDDTGVYLGAGVRLAVNDALELNGAVTVETVLDQSVSLDLKALYEIATGFSGLVETRFGDDPALGLGLRFYWR